MAQISDIIETLDALLSPGDFDDLGPNGLQVPGALDVERVVTAVSARRELSERAAELDAQLVLVHHGLFWKFHPTGLTPLLAERLRPLFKHDINLAAYHLPLDAHPEVGNNALLAKALGCDERRPFGNYKGVPIGAQGEARRHPARTRRPRARGHRPRAAAARRAARSASAASGSSPARPPTRCTRRRAKDWTRS